MQQQLHADEAQDHRQPLRQVDQALEQAADEEVQLAQPHQGEGICGEHDVRLFGQPVDRRDRVDREDQVDETDRDDGKEHRRDEAAPVLDDREPVALVGVADREVAPHEGHEAPVGGVVVVAGERLTVGEHQQQGAEEVEDPREVRDEAGPDRDERPAQDEGDDDPDHQHLLLVDLRHREARHQQQEDEQVVDREGLLGEVPGEVLAAVRPARHGAQAYAEQQRETDVERRPARGFADRGLVGLSHVGVELVHEERNGHREGDDPDERSDGHGAPDKRRRLTGQGLFRSDRTRWMRNAPSRP